MPLLHVQVHYGENSADSVSRIKVWSQKRNLQTFGDSTTSSPLNVEEMHLTKLILCHDTAKRVPTRTGTENSGDFRNNFLWLLGTPFGMNFKSDNPFIYI